MAPYTVADAIAYELQVVDHLKSTSCTNVYHWLDVPESVLYAAGWFTDHSSRRRHMLKTGKFLDLGLDAVCVNADGTYTGVQAKCFGGTSSSVTSRRIPQPSSWWRRLFDTRPCIGHIFR